MLNESAPVRSGYDTVSAPGPPENLFAVEAAVAASVFPLSVSSPEPPTMFSTSYVHHVAFERPPSSAIPLMLTATLAE